MSCSFEILPIPGREVVQKNFARLAEKSDSYSNRQVTLNERFAVIERGYRLKPVKQQPDTETPRSVKVKPIVQFGTTEEMISEMKAALDKKKKPNKDSHSIRVFSNTCISRIIRCQLVVQPRASIHRGIEETLI